MQSLIKEKVNFQEYVRWAFEQNKDTMKNQEDQDIQFHSYHELDGEEMGQVIWLFRKCGSINKIKKLNGLFLGQLFILNHIINFLLTIIHYSKPAKESISRLMKSIGIIQTDEELQLVKQENDELLSIVYEKEVVQMLETVTKEDFKILFQVIFDLKDISTEEIKKISELGMLFDQNQSQQEYSPSILKQNFGIIMAQIIQIEKIEIDQNTLLQSSIKLEQKKKEKAQAKKIQELSQHKQQIIKFSKVIYHQQPQRKLLLYDGTIITGNIWDSYQDQYCVPISLSIDTNVVYFSFRIEHLNDEQLFRKDQVFTYKGPVNENFDPNVKKAQYDLGIKGQLSQQQNTYRGCFSDGLFDGIGSLYIGNQLYFDGEFKLGIQYGFGRELQNNEDYLEGNFENGKKNGLFQFIKLHEGKKYLDTSKPQKCFQNGKEVLYLNQGYQLQKKKSNLNPTRYLLNFGDYGVNNYQLQSLQPGRWLNSGIIDLVISQIQTYREQISQSYKQDQRTVFINCSQSQDIFGSLISKNDEIQTKIFRQIIDYSKKQQPSRFVFYLNLDRSHFLSVVYENQTLYLIDSMKDKRADLLYQMVKLLNQSNFAVKNSWQVCEVSQQYNQYDCGMFTIYYISQIMKNIDLSIPQMFEKQCFNVQQSRINYARYLLANRFFQLGIEILEL
ncbi:unnamed protein product (macronuclear) [Paramecium tetraurelia]|uniref:Ubiquitin-like protease family profile domain-containing protein n=1 Tax=Paramecium tetraurelia TaxID=5888 RepID=A0DR33_PARTE|nr:uncharacterized protein GSPATT00002901001 [Paramecium tetraurelia]CAK85500.1 unnamed protein product [Paramecium tetraurelia]|eukprot:XP_001452897.1 hypothetical protein (macronuclear) [Paramecium tetraurelia strain d4-2]